MHPVSRRGSRRFFAGEVVMQPSCQAQVRTLTVTALLQPVTTASHKSNPLDHIDHMALFTRGVP